MSTATLSSPLLNTAQVALILNRTPQTVREMARNEEIGCIRRNSRSIQFTQKHVDEYLTAHEVPAKTAAPKKARPSRNPKYAGR